MHLSRRRQGLREELHARYGHTRSLRSVGANHAAQSVRAMRNGYHPSRRHGHDTEQTLKEQGFYHTSAWRRNRLLALQRDHYLCQACLARGKITPATEVHHVKELEDHPELGLELSNLQSLCWYCHEETKRRKAPEPVTGVKVIRISDGKEMEGWSNAD